MIPMLSTAKAEKYRREHPMGFKHKTGDPFGFFMVPIKMNGPVMAVQISPAVDQYEFDHVSVSLPHRTPTWDEMCKVKDLFFEDEDVVVQFHPAKSQFVNFAKNCLHMWRWAKGKLPTPQAFEVGPSKDLLEALGLK